MIYAEEITIHKETGHKKGKCLLSMPFIFFIPSSPINEDKRSESVPWWLMMVSCNCLPHHFNLFHKLNTVLLQKKKKAQGKMECVWLLELVKEPVHSAPCWLWIPTYWTRMHISWQAFGRGIGEVSESERTWAFWAAEKYWSGANRRNVFWAKRGFVVCVGVFCQMKHFCVVSVCMCGSVEWLQIICSHYIFVLSFLLFCECWASHVTVTNKMCPSDDPAKRIWSSDACVFEVDKVAAAS